ncbi:hypothetical protein MUG87_18625 [Ectobacillus sp. JY-23]|uniref:hypothetical protein n=1 Tax=Ectobacillus sp. JY-23 TaxID=2933872 RepID=UPI001FF0FDB3|nr:hypothetical protein [Ectobacillus sp. JY-23]UOY92410.1 hypothetical protein MUG87_18625 [Ectobacillus sp. JY-23]
MDCKTDSSGMSEAELARLLAGSNDHGINRFFQQIRRRLSTLECPLVTARGDGKSYIYANFNPKYAQYALIILRTYYNFCLPFKTGKHDERTPAQRLGLTEKTFSLHDLLYIR